MCIQTLLIIIGTKSLNRLEINALGRELSKQGVQNKRMGTGNDRVHIWSGLALRSKLREDVRMPCNR